MKSKEPLSPLGPLKPRSPGSPLGPFAPAGPASPYFVHNKFIESERSFYDASLLF